MKKSLALCVFLCSTQLIGQTTGQAFFNNCQIIERINWTQLNSLQGDDQKHAQWCLAYTEGLMDAFAADLIAVADEHGERHLQTHDFCLYAGMSLPALDDSVRMIMHRLKTKHEKRIPVTVVAVQAMRSAYPCHKDSNSTSKRK